MSTPSLDRLRVATPCPASWESMQGDARVRFCALCRRNVYNLSALSQVEALALLARHSEGICGLLYRRADGTVLTADCPVGVRTRLARRLRRVAALAAGLLLAFGGRFLTGPTKQRIDRLRVTSPPPPASGMSAAQAKELEQLIGSLGYVEAESTTTKAPAPEPRN